MGLVAVERLSTVTVAQQGERVALPLLDLAAVLPELDHGQPSAKPAERATGLDLRHLPVVADQDQLAAHAADRLRELDELPGPDHGGLVDRRARSFSAGVPSRVGPAAPRRSSPECPPRPRGLAPPARRSPRRPPACRCAPRPPARRRARTSCRHRQRRQRRPPRHRRPRADGPSAPVRRTASAERRWPARSPAAPRAPRRRRGPEAARRTRRSSARRSDRVE